MIDQELIRQMRQGDEDAFSILVDRYSGYVAAILCNLCRGKLNTQDVEELAADVFLSIWNHAEQIDPDRPLKPYLARTARNGAFSRLRKFRGELVSYEDDVSACPSFDKPDTLAESREQTEILNETVRGFGEPEREIFVRYYFFGEKLGASRNVSALTRRQPEPSCGAAGSGCSKFYRKGATA